MTSGEVGHKARIWTVWTFKCSRNLTENFRTTGTNMSEKNKNHVCMKTKLNAIAAEKKNNLHHKGVQITANFCQLS